MKIDNLLLHVNYGLTSGKVIHNCAVLCRKGKIFSIGGASAFAEANYDYRIDLPDCYLTPGFIDPHLYGFKGYSIMDEDTAASALEIARQLPSHGVTTFLASMQATTAEKELKVLDQLNSLESEEGSKIALLSKNCAHWIINDLAIWMAGHISVPIFPTLTSSGIQEILDH